MSWVAGAQRAVGPRTFLTRPVPEQHPELTETPLRQPEQRTDGTRDSDAILIITDRDGPQFQRNEARSSMADLHGASVCRRCRPAGCGCNKLRSGCSATPTIWRIWRRVGGPRERGAWDLRQHAGADGGRAIVFTSSPIERSEIRDPCPGFRFRQPGYRFVENERPAESGWSGRSARAWSCRCRHGQIAHRGNIEPALVVIERTAHAAPIRTIDHELRPKTDLGPTDARSVNSTSPPCSRLAARSGTHPCRRAVKSTTVSFRRYDRPRPNRPSTQDPWRRLSHKRFHRLWLGGKLDRHALPRDLYSPRPMRGGRLAKSKNTMKVNMRMVTLHC
jgi:hypothetical protein